MGLALSQKPKSRFEASILHRRLMFFRLCLEYYVFRRGFAHNPVSVQAVGWAEDQGVSQCRQNLRERHPKRLLCQAFNLFSRLDFWTTLAKDVALKWKMALFLSTRCAGEEDLTLTKKGLKRSSERKKMVV